MHNWIVRFIGAVWILIVLSGPSRSAPANDGPKVYRDKVQPHWFESEKKFWYRNDLSGGRREFILVNAEKGTRARAFDHERVAKTLSTKRGEEIDPEKLPFEEIRFSDDGKSIRLIGDSAWSFDFEKYDATEEKIEKPEKTEVPREERRRGHARERASAKSPDEKWEAFVRGDNLFVREIASGKERAFTHDGNPGNSYARSNQRERTVAMRYEEKDPETPAPEVYWSPNSKYLVAMKTRPGTERIVYMVESSPAEQLQPKLQSYPYAKPGDEIAVSKPRLFDTETGREIEVRDELFANPWSIGDLRWAKDSSRFTFLFNQRGHQVLRVVSVDASTGECNAIVDEQSKTFVNYSGKFYCEYLDDSNEIIWMSERDGWNHLYLYDAHTGEVKGQITKGEWVVRGVEKVDVEKRQIWFRAGGIREGQNPYFIHHCRVNFDGSDLIVLTEGNGSHSVGWSPERSYFIDTWSRVDAAPITELRQARDGKPICKLEEADIGEAASSGVVREPFVARGRDGETDIYGIIHRPANTDETQSYPVLESIYAGPHDSFVPVTYRASYSLDKLVKRGFVVVQIDGMGTSNRSKKFHDVCWKNIGDSGFPDRILWIKAAAEKHRYMDLSRLGIYGTSAGGQSALRGLLMHGDFYKAGVSDCGCHDNRMDKIWWNEQWMGWPVGPHYDEQSNVTQAHRLSGKLLLMVGELDKNVDPASTMQVVNALVKAEKDFELLVMPGTGHGVARTPYGWRRLEDFFVRALLKTPEKSGSATVAAQN